MQKDVMERKNLINGMGHKTEFSGVAGAKLVSIGNMDSSLLNHGSESCLLAKHNSCNSFSIHSSPVWPPNTRTLVPPTTQVL